MSQEPPDPLAHEGYRGLARYNYLLLQQAQEIEKMGWPVTVALPKTGQRMVGYEIDTNPKAEDYDWKTPKAIVKFTPGRSVFYKFNWVPDDADELSVIYFSPSAPVFADAYVRTQTVDNPTPYGDVIFKVVRVFDEGIYRTLRRTCFCRMMNDEQLWNVLFPSRPKA